MQTANSRLKHSQTASLLTNSLTYSNLSLNPSYFFLAASNLSLMLVSSVFVPFKGTAS